MSYYLAIDAGGTKTNCLLADDKRVLARASTGTVKLMRVSGEEATLRLQSLVVEVARAAGVSLDRITRTCFGLAGITSPAVQTWARQIIPAIVAGEFLLVGDEEIALDAAFAGGSGILVIAGTGSNVIGRDAAGSLSGAGGWGPVLGDEGSGFWIGLEAVRAALQAQDRIGLDGASSSLLRDIEAYWQLESLAELVAFANQRSGMDRPPLDFAALAPIVADCAERGDALAAAVLKRAGEELAAQVALVFRKMTAGPSPSPGPEGARAIQIAYTGSVLARIGAVRAAMLARLAVTIPAARVHPAPVDPLDGALWRAQHPSMPRKPTSQRQDHVERAKLSSVLLKGTGSPVP